MKYVKPRKLVLITHRRKLHKKRPLLSEVLKVYGYKQRENHKPKSANYAAIVSNLHSLFFRQASRDAQIDSKLWLINKRISRKLVKCNQADNKTRVLSLYVEWISHLDIIRASLRCTIVHRPHTKEINRNCFDLRHKLAWSEHNRSNATALKSSCISKKWKY